MKAFLRFAAWATLAFFAAWLIQHPYQNALAALAVRTVALLGTEVEWQELELFFPFDLSIYAALCLASAWAPWRTRLRALALGLPVLMVIEVLTLVAMIQLLLASQNLPEARFEEVQRFVIGLIRLTGLVAAGCAWLYLLGWQQLPQFASRLVRSAPVSKGGKP